MIGQDSVDLLRHPPVEAAEAGLHVCHRDVPLRRRQGAGRASRDFIYVDDVVRGLLLCATTGLAGDVYNLASGVETSIAELAALVKRTSGSPTAIEWVPGREWDRSGRRVGSVEKAKRVLGFVAEVPLETGLVQTIEWTRANLALIEACMGKHRAHLAGPA